MRRHDEPPIDVTIAGSPDDPRTHTAPEGTRIHRVPDLHPDDVVTLPGGLRVTSVARTLVDLASSLSLPDLGRACHKAGIKHGTTPREVEAVLERRTNAKGARNLRLITRGDAPISLSRLESRFIELCDRAGFPRPKTNRPAGGRRVDCRWPDPPLTVELDGYRFHNSRHAWEQDRRREREARARGDDFRRYTYGDVFDDPRYLMAELSGLFRARRPG